jgi:pyridoxamine 5'-phosphate oxidase
MRNSNTDDPLTLFDEWYAEAHRLEIDVPTAMTLATADATGRVSARMVLLKQHDADGFVFYTNRDSRKGLDLSANPHAALLFHWKSLKRQVRIEGTVALVGDDEADAYFASRDRGSQIGAWASKQSRPMPNRHSLEIEVALFTAKFGLGGIERPADWAGYRLKAHAIEFWRDGKFRLHERLVYTRHEDGWKTERLFP